jgi:hypothetical protein
MTNDYATEFQQAFLFKFDLIKHVNPSLEMADKIFAWGIEPRCETSHDGMKQRFCKLGETFQVFSLDKDKRRCRTMPHEESRCVHLWVDQLSSLNFQCLKINLSSKLTELGTSKLVLPMLESLAWFTCTINYLHKTRMHRNYAIYRTHYGGFLQAFRCHLKQKEITGEPVKKMQHHKRFLYIVNRAHRRARMKRYLGGKTPSDFSLASLF